MNARSVGLAAVLVWGLSTPMLVQTASAAGTKTAEDFFREGVDHLNAGRHVESVQSFQFCVQYKPDQKECWFNLGVAHGRQRQFAREADAYKKAVRLDPNYGRAHFNLGVVLEDLGQSDAALLHYERAVAADPKAHDARLNRAMVLLSQRRVDEAIRALRAAIEVKPDNPEAWFDLAGALEIKALKSQSQARSIGLNRAVEAYQKALEIEPRHHRATYNIGLVLHRLKDRGGEIAMYRKCLALRPNYAPALYNLAFALRDNKEAKLAREAFAAYLKATADRKRESRFRAIAKREMEKL